MKLIRKGQRPNHRGVIGIEAAIVLIAFVIVAAALAFVVLNMGFSTTQKAKTAIIAALEEAGSSLEVSGKLTAAGDIEPSLLNGTNVPLKIVSGGASSNLDGNVTSIKFISDTREYDNIYLCGPLSQGTYTNASMAWDAVLNGAFNGPDCGPAGLFDPTAGNSPYTFTNNAVSDGSGPTRTLAIIYWTVNINDNTIIDVGEHAVLSVGFAQNDRPASLEHIAFEISVPTGAPLTVDRTVPNVTTEVVDLG